MAAYCAKTHPSCEAVISSGDNFYDSGVTSVNDKQWRESFEDVYTAPSLQVPWHACLGNHDHQYNRWKHQIEYSSTSSRWKMLDRYYFVDFDYSTFRIRYIFIDTTPLIKSYQTRFGFDGDALRALDSSGEQMRWLNQTLRGSSAQFNIVVGHHPVYSASKHGDTDELTDILLPVLNDNNVTAYISGHDHNLQYLTRTFPESSPSSPSVSNHTLHQFVTGAGSKTDSYMKNHPHLYYDLPSNGFISMSFNSSSVTVEFRGVDSNEPLYDVRIPAIL
eukprot:GILK01000989.1.p1 GENE.GILK01000989.1~~GILK01000989.1.p1  ORF type:complete len:324 (-),score=52.50 GILK01000989.1:99-926(-)